MVEYSEPSKIGFVVGLSAEARLLRHTGCAVEIGGGDAPGAARAANRLIEKKLGAIISFGLAGGLNPMLRPGAVLVPQAVIDDEEVFSCDNGLMQMLGGANSRFVISLQHIAESAAEKRRLFEHSGADAVDLESGAVARAAAANAIPFAVLRAVTDPAQRNLPPAALIALNSAGDIKITAVLDSILKQPTQIPALLAIASDAAKARAALIRRLQERQRFFA